MHALSIEGLRKTYDNQFTALKGIDLTVEEGEFFALLGPNGAGKSTTIGIVSSLVNKTDGRVSIFGYDLDRQKEQAKSMLGLVPQEFNMNIFEPILEVIINQAGYYGIPRSMAKERAEYYLHKLDLYEKRKEPAIKLSGGMKRRLMIARGLVHDPKLLILDEPTAGVDIEIRRSMWDFLQEINADGTTIILTTHYLEEAEALCKRMAIINQGEIMTQGLISELLGNAKVETYVLDIQEQSHHTLSLPDYIVNRYDSQTLEVALRHGQSFNALFAELSKKGIEVMSMRNKSNRLEEFFLNLVKEGKA